MNERVFLLHRRASLRKFFEWASFIGLERCPGNVPRGPFLLFESLNRIAVNEGGKKREREKGGEGILCYRSEDIIFP